MSDQPKLCLFCKFFQFTAGKGGRYVGYEADIGSEAYLECGNVDGRWVIDCDDATPTREYYEVCDPATADGLRAALATAATCPGYKHYEEPTDGQDRP